jgi:hypothetical protein
VRVPAKPAGSDLRAPAHKSRARSEENQRGCHRHDQQVHHHVCSKKMMIQMSQRRCGGHPYHGKCGRACGDSPGHGWIPAFNEASRAGVCPDGCSVSRKATSAVVCAGFRFFP